MKLGRAIKHDIVIKATSNLGFTVAVGCAFLAFKDGEDLLAALKEYFKHPEKLEKEHNKIYGSEIEVEDPHRTLGIVAGAAARTDGHNG